MTTNNIYSLRNNYVYSMPTNQLFSLNFTISNQSASGIKSEIRPLICQRTHYGNLERQNRFKSSSFQITAAMFFKFCKLILKITVALDKLAQAIRFSVANFDMKNVFFKFLNTWNRIWKQCKTPFSYRKTIFSRPGHLKNDVF